MSPSPRGSALPLRGGVPAPRPSGCPSAQAAPCWQIPPAGRSGRFLPRPPPQALSPSPDSLQLIHSFLKASCLDLDILGYTIQLHPHLLHEVSALFFNPLHIIYYSLPFLNNNRPLLSLFPKTDDKFVDFVVVPFSN